MRTTHQYIALLLAGAALAAGPAFASAPVTLTCSNWVQKYTSDPGVDLKVDLEGEAIELRLDNGRLTGLTLPDPAGLFDPAAFDETEPVSSRVARPDTDSIAIRRVATTWSDSLLISGLDDQAPRVFWQRMRIGEGALRETLIVGTCSVG